MAPQDEEARAASAGFGVADVKRSCDVSRREPKRERHRDSLEKETHHQAAWERSFVAATEGIARADASHAESAAGRGGRAENG